MAFRGVWAAAWVAFLSLSCSASDHPPVYVDSPTGGGGGDGFDGSGTDVGTGDAGAAGSVGGTVPSGGASTSTGTGTGTGVENSNNVYLAGSFKSSGIWGLAPVSDPNQVAYGYFQPDTIGFRGSNFLYAVGSLSIFKADGQGKPTGQAAAIGDSAMNDVVVSTKPCTTVSDFLTNAESRLIYQCEGSGLWFEGGKQVYDGQHRLSWLGSNNLGLSYDGSNGVLDLVNLVDGSLTAVSGDFSGLVRVRSHGTGFHVVTRTKLGLFLVNIDAAGVASQVAAYPASATQFDHYSSALDANDMLYELGAANMKITIMRFHPDGLGETVYTANDDDLLDWTATELTTGP